MLQRTGRRVGGHCIECDAVLHVGLQAVVAAHGETATLEKSGYTILCPVCEAAGLFLRESRDHSHPHYRNSVPQPTKVVSDRPASGG